MNIYAAIVLVAMCILFGAIVWTFMVRGPGDPIEIAAIITIAVAFGAIMTYALTGV